MARKRGAGAMGKGKALVPPMKGAAKGPPPPPPPRAMRGRVALAIPVLRATPTRGRPGPVPTPGRTPPGRLAPPPPVGRRVPMALETPRAERLEAPPMGPRPSSTSPVMRQRGARQTMAAMRRGAVPF